MLQKNEKISHSRITNKAQGAEGYSGLQRLAVAFQVNFALRICLLKCSDVLTTKFILLETLAKKRANFLRATMSHHVIMTYIHELVVSHSR